jgi:hypothetical protein
MATAKTATSGLRQQRFQETIFHVFIGNVPFMQRSGDSQTPRRPRIGTTVMG